MKISAQLFVTPRCLPMVGLLTIVVESFELMKVLALIVDTPGLGPKAELVCDLEDKEPCALLCAESRLGWEVNELGRFAFGMLL